MRSRTIPVVLFVALLLGGGCHNDAAQVSGRVTQNGKPLAGAVVTFQPGGVRGAPPATVVGSVGRTDTEGRYSLRMISPDQPGAAVGEHSVTISLSGDSSEAGEGKVAKAPVLPKAWQDGSQRFKVPPGGTSAANFDIK